MEQAKNLVDVGEIARILQVSKLTVYRMAAEGRIPSFKIGRNRRFDVAAVLEAMKDAGTTARA